MPFDENKEPERKEPFMDRHFASQLYAIEAIDVAFSVEAIKEYNFCYNCVVGSATYNLLIKLMQLRKANGGTLDAFIASVSALWEFVEKMEDPEEPSSMGPPPTQEP